MKEYNAMELENFFVRSIADAIADSYYFATHTETQQDLAAKKQLKETVSKFSREQLHNFMALVNKAKLEAFLFMSGDSADEMFADLNTACRKKDCNVPSIYGDKFKEFVETDPAYFFNYLSTKTVAQIFCNHVDKHIPLVAKAAKVFYRSGLYAARDFLISELHKR